MKITRRILLTLLFVSLQFIPYLSAEDYNRGQLPEGAKLRLGKGLLHDIKFTPDGKRVAVATEIGIWIYDAHTGKELALLTGHKQRVTSIDFPADGRFLASGSFDGTVRLWDIDTGKQTALFAGHRAGIGAIAVSPDGKTVVSGDSTWKGVLILWDVETGEQIKRHTRYTDNLIRRSKIWLDKSRKVPNPNAIEALAFSPDGKTFVSGHRDSILRLWKAETGRKFATVRDHKRGGIEGLVFSPDGKMLASSTMDGIMLHTFPKGKPMVHNMHGVPFPENLVFSPDGTNIIGSGYLGRETIGKKTFVHKWDAVTGRLLMSTPTEHTDQLEALAVSPDGNTVLTGSWDGTIHKWDLETGTDLSTFATGHGRGARALEFSKDGQALISWLGRDRQQFWDTTIGAQISDTQLQKASEKEPTPSPNRVIFARMAEDRESIQVRDAATGNEMYQITGHKGKIWTFAYSPDWKTLASASEDATIRLWDVATGNETLILHTDTYSTFAIAFSPDAKILAGGSVYDHTQGGSNLIRLWDISNGRILATIAGHTSTIVALRFSNDAKTLASSSNDGTILLWDLDKIARSER